MTEVGSVTQPAVEEIALPTFAGFGYNMRLEERCSLSSLELE